MKIFLVVQTDRQFCFSTNVGNFASSKIPEGSSVSSYVIVTTCIIKFSDNESDSTNTALKHAGWNLAQLIKNWELHRTTELQTFSVELNLISKWEKISFRCKVRRQSLHYLLIKQNFVDVDQGSLQILIAHTRYTFRETHFGWAALFPFMNHWMYINYNWRMSNLRVIANDRIFLQCNYLTYDTSHVEDRIIKAHRL